MTDPLKDLVVLDLTRLLPGPLCSLYLADFGARVIKIEDKAGGDPLRHMPHLFNLLNRNKESIALNLKDENDLKCFYELVKSADIVIESFRPSVPQKLKIDYETLKKINAKLIYCSITGYGQTGPLKDHAGHDLNYMALSGTLDQIGNKNSPPQMLNLQVSDIAGGSLMGCIGILTAVIGRAASGVGRYVDIAMLDSTFSLNLVTLAHLNVAGKTPKRGNDILSGKVPYYQIYETNDQRYMALAAFEKKFWINFCNQIAKPEWITFYDSYDPNSIKLVGEYFKSNSFDYWLNFFTNCDCCLTPILNLSEVIESEQIKARNLVYGNSGTKSIGNPIKMSDYQFTIKSEAPALNQHKFP